MRTKLLNRYYILEIVIIIILMGYTLISDAATVFGKVFINGRTDYSGVTVSIEGTSYSAVTDSSGNYLIPNIAPGLYRIYAQAPGYLVASQPDVDVSDTTFVDTLQLIPGDFVVDGEINLLDMTKLAEIWGARKGDRNWDETRDILRDGIINEKDSQLLVKYWDKQGAKVISSSSTATVPVTADFGKTVELADGAAISIPPMALSSNTTITVEVTADPSTAIEPDERLVGKVYRIDAGDVVFQKPITITLPYEPSQVPAGISEEDLCLAYWDGNRWVAQESLVDTTSHKITAWTDHLTTWSPRYVEIPKIGKFYAEPPEYSTGNFQNGEFREDLTFKVEISNPEDIKDVTIRIGVYSLGAWGAEAVTQVAATFTDISPVAFFVKKQVPYSEQIKMSYKNGVYIYVWELTKLKAIKDLTTNIREINVVATVTNTKGKPVKSKPLIVPIYKYFRPEIILKSPEDNGTASPTPVFTWYGIDYQTDFDKLEIAIDYDKDVWNRPIFKTALSNVWDQEYQLPAKESLKDGKTYYWGVRLKYKDKEKDDVLSDIYKFTVHLNMPPTVTLLKPADKSSADPFFEWKSSDPEGDITNYDLYIDNDKDIFSEPMFHEHLGSDTTFSYWAYVGEPPPDTYYWCIEAYNIDADTQKEIANTRVTSDVWSFTVEPPILYVSDTSLDFAADEDSKELNIRNYGGGLMKWKITWPKADIWLNVSPSEEQGNWIVKVTIDRTKLPLGAGPHKSQLTITTASDSKKVSISVEAHPTVVENKAPDAQAYLSAKEGEVPFKLKLICIAKDEDGKIVKIEWDFDSDGIYDWDMKTDIAEVRHELEHVYKEPGEYKATLRATDNDGAQDTDTTATITVTAAKPTIAIQPASKQISTGESFTIEVVVSNISNLFGASFELQFDGNILEGVSVSEGDFLGGDVIPFHKIEPGLISVGITREAGANGVNGEGVIAKITLSGKAVGQTEIQIPIKTLALQTPDTTPIKDFDNVEVGGCSVKVTAGEGGEVIIGGDGAEMVLIPAGEFEMGDNFNEGDGDERPVHTVYLDAFYIDKYEVTNVQYAEFLNAYGKNVDAAGHQLLDIRSSHCLIRKMGDIYKPRVGYEDHPVVEVSCYGAAAYAQFYGKRLPTEAEWEKAARGGLAGKRYPWGNDITHDDANYSRTGGKDKWDKTSPVGSFAPNGYGLYDMAGNVWECCADDFTKVRSRCVIRGGDWNSTPLNLRCAGRAISDPYYPFDCVGFRCSQDQ